MTSQLRNKLSTAGEQVAEAYRNGATLKEIGLVHNVSSGTVRNCLIELGVELRPRGRQKPREYNNERRLPVEDLSPEGSE